MSHEECATYPDGSPCDHTVVRVVFRGMGVELLLPGLAMRYTFAELGRIGTLFSQSPPEDPALAGLYLVQERLAEGKNYGGDPKPFSSKELGLVVAA